MKKTICAFLSAVLAFSLLLTSCGEEKNENHIEKNKVGSYSFGTESLSLFFWQGDDNSAVLDICNEDGKTVQTLDFPSQTDYYLRFSFAFARENVQVNDYNFDGANDLYVPCSVTTPNMEGICWLWNNDEGAFELSDELSRLPELDCDPTARAVTSIDYMSGQKPAKNYYVWQDGSLVFKYSTPVPAETEPEFE